MKANLSSTVSPDGLKTYKNKGTAHLSMRRARVTSVPEKGAPSLSRFVRQGGVFDFLPQQTKINQGKNYDR